MRMKTPDRRITVLAYTLLTIWLSIYAYACLATNAVTVKSPDVALSAAQTTDASTDTTDAPADSSNDSQWTVAIHSPHISGLLSRFASLEKKDTGDEKRFRVSAELHPDLTPQ